MEGGFYKANDTGVSVHDWVRLNFESIPTDVLLTLYTESNVYMELVSEKRAENAWPAAHGTMWRAPRDVKLEQMLEDAGFVVYMMDEPFDGELLFGVDGGGYSFEDEHWQPLRAAFAKRVNNGE